MPKYVFYERFLYTNNSSLYRGSTQIVNRVTVYVHPQQSLIKRMERCREAKYNKHSDKLYIRERIRKAKVLYTNTERFSHPEFACSYVSNTGLNLNHTKGLT